MEHAISSHIIIPLFSFFRHFLGTIFKPYQTYRELVKNTHPEESIYLFLLVMLYIGLASILRKGIDSGPLFLTLHFGKIFWGIVFTFIFSWGAIYFIGKLFGGTGEPKSLFLPWAYSLLPTLCWFILTSFFYYFLPPPRTTAITGQIFSVFYLAITLTIFYWKGVLYYLTLRFGHKLSVGRIILVSLIIFPLGILYSIYSYRLGIFRVPFI